MVTLMAAIIGLCWVGPALPDVPMGRYRLRYADHDPLLFGDMVLEALMEGGLDLLNDEHQTQLAFAAMALQYRCTVPLLGKQGPVADRVGNSEAPAEQATVSS